ncbi:hypothetical protein BU26DRAFT_348853 [Trematosphaeria pertusa]|uniref:Uncharacterized protein n=1 Tax=Trematosphaeria pertusa TaxID=390896 RepID=A0A6A6IAV2_9PLEO|nr:uncharacterized protein BU26DRAFT_348853 [Trematosphaeria pertusa]KAF2247511.1 hypothetical protein BU26DRAFT_348853 [Trematosphaeria pertusa]
MKDWIPECEAIVSMKVQQALPAHSPTSLLPSSAQNSPGLPTPLSTSTPSPNQNTSLPDWRKISVSRHVPSETAPFLGGRPEVQVPASLPHEQDRPLGELDGETLRQCVIYAKRRYGGVDEMRCRSCRVMLEPEKFRLRGVLKRFDGLLLRSRYCMLTTRDVKRYSQRESIVESGFRKWAKVGRSALPLLTQSVGEKYAERRCSLQIAGGQSTSLSSPIGIAPGRVAINIASD